MRSEQKLSLVLSDFARTMVTDFSIETILDKLVERIVEILPVVGAGVTLISPGIEPHYVAASSASALRFEEIQSELGQGPCVLSYTTGQAILVPDLREEVRFGDFTSHAVQAGLAAVFAFPLRHGSSQLGALDLFKDEVGPLSTQNQHVAQTLADVAAAYISNAQARSDLQDSSARAHQASLHDALTGLANRDLLFQRLLHAFSRNTRSGKTSGLLFIDLDRFKAVNDLYGHQVGDELLVAVATRLSGLLRAGDTLARLSGDEFVVLCEDLDTSKAIDPLLARLKEAMTRPFAVSNGEVHVTASVGISFADPSGDSPEELLRRADQAMYKTKRDHSGTYQTFSHRDQRLVEQTNELQRDLPDAKRRGELHVAYQPIVATANGRVVGVEALLRWAHPRRGPVEPSILIPIAEQSGLILDIGQWVLRQAWTDRTRWLAPPDAPDLTMSVNVSVTQLMSPGFVKSVRAVVDKGDADASLLHLEVTETVFVHDSERALHALRDLKAAGIVIALDDFGTGYSSLSHLARFPVDIVKIDKSFVSHIGDADLTCRAIVAAVIHLAHDLGMTVTAEGVETAQQHNTLTALGCDAFQGFYFAQPQSAVDIQTLLAGVQRGTVLSDGNAVAVEGSPPTLAVARRSGRPSPDVK